VRLGQPNQFVQTEDVILSLTIVIVIVIVVVVVVVLRSTGPSTTPSLHSTLTTLTILQWCEEDAQLIRLNPFDQVQVRNGT
jgi:hypothetical protein